MRAPQRAHRRSARAEYLLPHEAASAGRARQLTSRFLDRSRRRVRRVDAERVDDAALIVSELVTNAALHGRSPCRLRVEVADAYVVVEVYDASPARPRLRPLTAEGESGRGLAMVRMLAQHFAVTPVAGGGKTVRAVLAD
ncbi:ATP-binding protein [Actinomycetota bacterium Odt1-20B]